MQSIQPLVTASLPHVVRTNNALTAGSNGGPSFEELLANSVRQLNSTRQQTNAAVENFSIGAENPTEVLTAIEQADSAYQTATQIGNRLVAAYDEIKDLRI
ncbi:MAG: flagellar hook-basal body complex protein FliE [Planctomycetia bacterium]|nr:flagellar hook-basal body complex protein FliE [Planctomycetia bacterium]